MLDADLRARPVWATGVGDHRFDDRWPDLTPSGRASDLARIDDAIASLEDLATQPMTLDDRVDLEMLEQALQLQAFEHRVEVPWCRDASWVVALVGQGLEDLLTREFAPLEQRAKTFAARVEALPGLLEASRTQLTGDAVMAPHLDVAIAQCPGLLELVDTTGPERLAAASSPTRARLDAGRTSARPAIAAYCDHLERLRPDAKGAWRLGAAAFDAKLALTLRTGIDGEALRRHALLEHRHVRDAMLVLAQRLAPVVLRPAERRRIARLDPMHGGGQLTHAVLDALGAAHGAAADLRDDAEATLAHLSAFVRAHDIVPLDPAEMLTVVWTPPHQRGVFIAGLAAPGALEPLDAKLPNFYYVQPPPPSWDADTTASYLREYNTFMLEILSIHEAIPGHFVQLYWSKRGAAETPRSRVRRAYPNHAFIEGWAVYGERVMLSHGYAGAPWPEERVQKLPKGLKTVVAEASRRADAIALHGLKFYLRTITNAILDAGIHADTMTREEALDLMVAQSFQQTGEAQAKWVRAQVTSTQLSTYFAGARVWAELRAEAEAQAIREGGAFDPATFHAAALSHGAPPLTRLRALMGPTTEDRARVGSVPEGSPPASRP